MPISFVMKSHSIDRIDRQLRHVYHIESNKLHLQLYPIVYLCDMYPVLSDDDEVGKRAVACQTARTI